MRRLGYNARDSGEKENGMGLMEKAKNITDTSLRILVRDSSDPSEALRQHILSLEESQRQLGSSRGFLERQRKWLESSAERKLKLAEEWESRAATAAKSGRDDLARHALLRKRELLRSMSEDRRQLVQILPQLEELEGRVCEVRQKILKARAARAKAFGAGGTVPEEEESSGAAPTAASHADDGIEEALPEGERKELDEELDDLKRRLESEEPD